VDFQMPEILVRWWDRWRTDDMMEPFFLDTPNGRLFAVYHRPAKQQPVRGHILCIPPFAEEMNRCRSMITLQAQAFAQIGMGTLLVDLHGTGDSAGEYRDAQWAIWLQDIRTSAAWLAEQPGGCLALWGIRLGVILAAESLRRAVAPGAALLAWQPVADGQSHLTQFLRIRLAAQMDRPYLPKETTASLRQQWAAGQSVEVAGYEIHPELAAALDAARLGDRVPPLETRILWIEQAGSQAPQLSLSSQKVVQAWRAAGLTPDIRLFEGMAFWQHYDRALAPDAIAATTAGMRAWVTAA
jgi:exosortase A-associated hydrolase 2